MFSGFQSPQTVSYGNYGSYQFGSYQTPTYTQGQSYGYQQPQVQQFQPTSQFAGTYNNGMIVQNTFGTANVMQATQQPQVRIIQKQSQPQPGINTNIQMMIRRGAPPPPPMPFDDGPTGAPPKRPARQPSPFSGAAFMDTADEPASATAAEEKVPVERLEPLRSVAINNLLVEMLTIPKSLITFLSTLVQNAIAPLNEITEEFSEEKDGKQVVSKQNLRKVFQAVITEAMVWLDCIEDKFNELKDLVPEVLQLVMPKDSADGLVKQLDKLQQMVQKEGGFGEEQKEAFKVLKEKAQPVLKKLLDAKVVDPLVEDLWKIVAGPEDAEANYTPAEGFVGRFVMGLSMALKKQGSFRDVKRVARNRLPGRRPPPLPPLYFP
eukprot:TRINITY_DN15916_c0_g1_i1.p1 TRINITY_DN15916_c0_g1~~TRINITY_DN15916_c0_g1_i1.p1  ORF type:complete len:378 (-),score=47.83 TRINITY_DN15916_c0_g1_i1:24-1157(-)